MSDLTTLSDEELRALRNRLFEERQPQARARVSRHGGLAGRAGVEGAVSGILGLPALAYDGTVGVLENLGRRATNAGISGLNRFAGTEFEPVEYRDPFQTTGAVMELGRRGADALSLPEPETAGERIAVEGGRAGISALTGAGGARVAGRFAQRAPEMVRSGLSTLGYRPATQAIAGVGAGVGGEGAAQEAERQGMGDSAQGFARATGSLFGGATAASVPHGARATGRALSTLTRPLRESGRDEIAGNILRRFSRDPNAVAARAADGGAEIVPGSRPTLGQVSRDPGIIQNENAIRSTADPTGRISQRMSGNAAARASMFDESTVPPGAVETMRSDLRRRTDELLNQQIFPNARQVTKTDLAKINRTISGIENSETGVRASVQGAMREARRALRDLERGGNTTNSRALYEARKELALLRDGRLDLAASRNNPHAPAAKLAKGEISRVIRAMDDAIENAAPGYRRYLDEYASRAREIDGYDMMNQIRSSTRAGIPDPVTGADLFNPTQFRRTVERRAGDIGKTLTKQQREVLDRISRDLQREQSGQAATMRVAGSDTKRNLSVSDVMLRELFGSGADNSLVSAAARPIMGPLEWLYRMPQDQIQDLLVDAILEPRTAARLLRSATEQNVESVSRDLARRVSPGVMRSTIAAGEQGARD